MSVQEYYSHGKLMICGEYAVLHGATAFVIPTRKGQWLRTETLGKTGHPLLEWKAYDPKGNIWFDAGFSLPHLITEYSSDISVSVRLIRFLLNARILNPAFLSEGYSLRVETELEFDPDEGLGSSSTLTNNIAQWAGINPFSLHFNAFSGSGFDVAAARSGKPLLYTMNGSDPKIEELEWKKPFRDKLFLVHLGKKQNSRSGLPAFQPLIHQPVIAQISRISRLISANDDYFEFCLLLELAETETGRLIGQTPVKQTLFPDYHGTVKSLGAWGGDYVLATGENTEEYFRSKGYRVVPFNDMMLT